MASEEHLPPGSRAVPLPTAQEIDERLEDCKAQLLDLDADFRDAKADYHERRFEVISAMMELQQLRRATT